MVPYRTRQHDHALFSLVLGMARFIDIFFNFF